MIIWSCNAYINCHFD